MEAVWLTFTDICRPMIAKKNNNSTNYNFVLPFQNKHQVMRKVTSAVYLFKIAKKQKNKYLFKKIKLLSLLSLIVFHNSALVSVKYCNFQSFLTPAGHVGQKAVVCCWPTATTAANKFTNFQ